MNTNTPYDIVYLLGLAGGVVFANPELAQAVAPYAAIFFAALVGSMWALSRQVSDMSPGHRGRGALFMGRVVGLALIVAVPAALILAPKLGITNERYLFSPLAFLIGAVGDDYKAFFNWTLNLFLRFRAAPGEK